MKIIFKLAAIAAAFGLAPATAYAATPAVSAPAATVAAAAGDEEGNAAAPVAALPRTAPTPSIGQPDGRYGLQDQVSPIGVEAHWFHDVILMPVITIITAFVLLLLLWVMFRFRRGANPTPSRNTHNTMLEIVWTLVPVLILVVIAVPSIRLLAHQYNPPAADLTVKVIGNQWYWEYQYPDHGVNLVSNMLPDADADRAGEPRQLAADVRMVVPVGAVVKLIVTSNDVVHAWGIPAFWTKIDAVPGRLNETWFSANREGVYYGVCYELCGVRHGYMPIAVEVVSRARFDAWVAANGGHRPGATPAAAVAALPPSTTTAEAPAPTAATNQNATR